MGAHVRTTVVPARAAELMVKVPPNDSALSRMMARPSWPAVASRGVKPTPSSSITSRTLRLCEKLTRAAWLQVLGDVVQCFLRDR